jgi:hypothetical protein
MNVLTLRHCHDHCSYITGTAMKCTTKLEDHVSTSVRENAIMLVGPHNDNSYYDMNICTTFYRDEGFEVEFLSPGTLLFLKELRVIR